MKTKQLYSVVIVLTSLFILLSPGEADAQKSKKITEGIFWKNQAVNNIIPYWSRHAMDKKYGAFFTNLDRNWKVSEDRVKYPSMISRHVFGYSVAYLLTGNEAYLTTASETVKFLIDKGWDKTYGGWYDALDEKGNPVQFTKDAFVQIYAITGLAMYYFVTHDSTALSYIEKSNMIMETKFRDGRLGGYQKMLQQNLEVKDSTKDFASEMAPVSGYLIYLYLATRENKYLEQMEKMMNSVVDKMRDPSTGWVLEYFNKDWTLPAGIDRNTMGISIGHNIETAWMLLRLYTLDNNKNYLETAKNLTEKIVKYGYNDKTGSWYNMLNNNDASAIDNSSVWWIQAYGNMFFLYLNQVTKEGKYLDSYSMSAKFWNDFMVDKEYGDTYLSVSPEGKVKEGTKANRYKASYHNMEHSMLSYLYLDMAINRRNVNLFFNIQNTGRGEKLYPVPIESDAAKIKSVTINGRKWNHFDSKKGFVNLPESGSAKIRVTFSK
jgi:mannose/cellobiose epimerase-like protein (N-acyl-D-glucosamine 2-epimerase family)